jgi:glycerate 2-kinase
MVAAVDPAQLVRRNISREGGWLLVKGLAPYRLEGHRLWLVALGKAAGPMAQAALEQLGEWICGGLVVSPCLETFPSPLRSMSGSYPEPGEDSLKAGEALFQLCNGLTKGDLLLVLLSGGGSALAVLPEPGLSLEAIRQVNQVLLHSALPIRMVNAVRKKLDRLKGGGLARAAHRALVIQLVLSDVVGNDLGIVASGPFLPDRSTATETVHFLRQSGLEEELPMQAQILLQAKASLESARAPLEAPALRVMTVLLGDNLKALLAGQTFLSSRGFATMILSSRLEGDVEALARFHAQLLAEVLESGHPLAPPCAILSGGESYLNVLGEGRGGRNQEFALRFLRQELEGETAWALLSAGTDGIDGNSPAAGAIVSQDTLLQFPVINSALNDALQRNDSFTFLERLGCALVTGPTGTNVADVRVILVPAQTHRLPAWCKQEQTSWKQPVLP